MPSYGGAVRSKLPIPFLAALLALWALAPASGAAALRVPNALPVPSSVSISGSGLGFRGRVRTPLGFCRRDRRVTLFKVVAGGPDEAMGHVLTGKRGRWRIALSGFAGISLTRFYAKVAPRHGHIASLAYACGGARSKKLRLGS